MKMKKLMSICAMSLAVVCCTSVTTFAAQNNESRSNAAKKVAENFFNGGRVFDDININIKTPIKNYVEEDLINEIKDLNITYVDSENNETKNILDENLGLNENLDILSEYQDQLKTNGNLETIKDFVKSKLTDYESAANGSLFDDKDQTISLADCIKCDFNVDAYGTLTVGKNMNGKATATLENKRGNILFQVNSENIYNMKNELSGINSWSKLKDWMKNYVDKSTLDGLNALNR
ncbi:hypothetical protein DVW02_14805 [Clostridium botulinum]|nr:hypothetical protein [Clostridium botulinum]